MGGAKKVAAGVSGWLAASPSKAAAERFFLRYSMYWIGVFGVVVVTGVYHVWLTWHRGRQALTPDRSTSSIGCSWRWA